jgi:hypothetical protein
VAEYNRQVETALRLIAKKGKKIIWRVIPDAESETEPWKAGEEQIPVDYSNISICFLPVDRVNTQLFRYLSQTDVIVGNMYGLMGAVNFNPSAKDVVIRSASEIYRISSIDTLKPADQVILHTIQFEV